jgi:hypothetical protein
VQSRWSSAEELDGDGGELVVGVHLATVRRLPRVRRTGCPQSTHGQPAELRSPLPRVRADPERPPTTAGSAAEYLDQMPYQQPREGSRRSTLKYTCGAVLADRPARIDRLVSRVVTPYAILRSTASYAIAQVDYSGAEMARLNEFEIAS